MFSGQKNNKIRTRNYLKEEKKDRKTNKSDIDSCLSFARDILVHRKRKKDTRALANTHVATSDMINMYHLPQEATPR